MVFTSGSKQAEKAGTPAVRLQAPVVIPSFYNSADGGELGDQTGRQDVMDGVIRNKKQVFIF